MPQVTVQTANRIYLTKAEATLLINALQALHNTTKLRTADGLTEIEGLCYRLQDFQLKSDWTPTEK